MKNYLVTYLINKRKEQRLVRGDVFINAYQTFIETYEWNEILSITRV